MARPVRERGRAAEPDERRGVELERERGSVRRASVARMLKRWVGKVGLWRTRERKQRKEAASEMNRALLHDLRFASDEEEMAWFKEKAAEVGQLESFEIWLEEGNLETPDEVWTATYVLDEFSFVSQLGPHVDLANMKLLTSLPDGLHVGGCLKLGGCTGLTSLPDGLRVNGFLNLEDCSGLTSLPNGMHLGGGLSLGTCTSLKSLPDDLRVNGNMYLWDCTGLTSLPNGIHVGGNLSIRNCNSLASLPDGLHVGDSLEVQHCTGLTSLPDGLHVGGYLAVEVCPGLTSLPHGLFVNGSLSVTDCTGLTSLPSDLDTTGYVGLHGCTGLTSLPDGLDFCGSLSLRGCTGLTSLPDGLRVEYDLGLEGCTGLTSLPDGLHFDGRLDLDGCTGLTSLPAGLRVEEGLSLRGCSQLMTLPDGLHVGDFLRLMYCTGLSALPDNLHVSGDLNLENCTGVTSLPDGVLEWGMRSNGRPHNIYLSGSGLPPEELARLQTLNNPALRFHVSRTETFGGFGLGADVSVTFDFATLDDAAAFWTKEAESPSELAISPFVEAAYVRGVLGFLSKLRRAKEFNNSLTKAGLASRVVQVLELLAGEDNGVREELQVRMADAVDTCSDKPMWALNQMQVLVHTVEARGDRAKLRALGMGVMRLEVVHKHVREAMDAMNFVDDVCVYLRFEIALRESLNLPVSALKMLYPSYVTVTDKSIAAAEAEALRLTEEDLDAWLPDWSEWQRQDRVEFAEGLDFSALKRNSTKRLSLGLRNLLDAKVTDPVRLKPLATVWSLQDLLKHWVNTGLDLNNTPRDVDYMRLNLTRCV